jgi:hypothetical protein
MPRPSRSSVKPLALPVPLVEPLWTISDLSDYLNVPVQTLYKWRTINYGPPGLRAGRHVRYHPDAVRGWVAEQQARHQHDLDQRS